MNLKQQIEEIVRTNIKQSLVNVYKGAYEDKSPSGCSYAPDLSSEKEIIRFITDILKAIVDWVKDHYWDSLEKDKHMIVKHIEDMKERLK